jgi:AraC family transcriptional regulator of adaptative response/methylated-DNA-[protein]-cysteine methyltransferase
MAALIADLAAGGSPRLARLAARSGRSPFHLQRSFRRWVGLSPRQFTAFATVGRAKGLLAAARSVLDVTLEVGLSGPGRLHDHFVSIEAMSPGESASGGAGVAMGFGAGDTPLGPALIAWTPRGICRLAFLDGDDGTAALRREWPRAALARDDGAAAALLARAFTAGDPRRPLPLVVRGTAFQVAVWRALLAIPAGAVESYGGLARELGRAGAERAVGSAVGANPIAYLIPCHRVIRASGVLGGYAWGLERKTGLLAGELAQRRSAGTTASSTRL